MPAVAEVPSAYVRELSAVKAGLRAIGYRGNLLHLTYPYADFFAEQPVIRTVTLAAFSQAPPSYVTACFAVVAPDGSAQDRVRNCLALGAPQVILLGTGHVDRWVVSPGKAPEYVQRIPTPTIREAFIQKQKEWSPDAVSRAKTPLPDAAPRQLDFVDAGFLPALEHQAQRKLDDFLVDVVRGTRAAYRRRHRGVDVPRNEVFHLLFGLIRAKVLKDTGVIADLDLRNPTEALSRVGAYDPQGDPLWSGQVEDRELLEMVAEKVRNSSLFQNLSVETLAYVYENTLVSRESRRQLGIHSTPSYIADYILGRLPIGQISLGKRRVLDPMCGQGTFLVAALRRLRGLLPPSMSTAERHDYFVSHLRGMEYELFSAEVAKLSLLLADLPNPNGWDIRVTDSFAPGVLEEAASWSSVLVANPPFEDFTAEQREQYQAIVPAKGGEMLRRVLPSLPDGGLIGVVLPRTFTDGQSYAGQRAHLASHFDLIEVTALPDGIFPKSGAETVLLMARKRETPARSRGTVLFRQVREGERRSFETRHAVTREERVPQQRLLDATTQQFPVFWVPLLYDLWDALAECPRIHDYASVHRGVEYQVGLLSADRDALIRHRPFPGGRRGLSSASDQLAPYLLGRPVYLESRPEYRRGNAWDLPWSETKVVANANVSSRGPWRISAAVDRQGLTCTQTFHALWPRCAADSRPVPPEVIAAIVNGPICNAYLYAHEGKMHNQKRTLGRVPFPAEWASVASEVTSLVAEYAAADAGVQRAAAEDFVLRIDALLLAAYSLAPRDERRLLDLFWDYPRHGLPGWRGYISPEFTAWVPLRMFLSDDFRRSTLGNLAKGAPSLADAEIQHLFDLID